MRTESQLIQQIQRAGSLAEQASLIAELDALKASQRTASRRDGEIDLASTMVQASQTPVLVHTMHTAATDWLDDVQMSTEADVRTATNAMAAEASLWFTRTSADVKADHEEFGEQARGMARRLAGKYGEQAPAAAQAFLDYAAFLHRREAASGLDQVQQITAPDGVTQRRTPLNEEVFDTFNQPVDSMNVGIDEMQTTENAPLLNEIMQNGNGMGQPEVMGGHSDTQPIQPMGSLVDAPSLASGYLYNLDDFRRSASDHTQKCTVEGCDNQQSHNFGEDGNDDDMCSKHAREKAKHGSRLPFAEAAEKDHGPHGDDEDKPKFYDNLNEKAKDNFDKHDGKDPSDKSSYTKQSVPPEFLNQQKKKESTRTVVSRVTVEAASGLPQVQQIVDPQENLAPMPLPQEQMFPLVGPFGQQMNTNGTGEAMPAAPLAGQGQGPMRQGSRKLASTGTPEFKKGFGFAANWQPGDRLVRKGSAQFEAGLFAGMANNTATAQQAWVQSHELRGGVFARRIAVAREFAKIAQAGDVDVMSPDATAAPGGNTPFNGPGTPPPLAGGMDAAAPGGASPYNGAAPLSAPVAPDPLMPDSGPMPTPGMTMAFRQRVQRGVLAEGKR